MAVFPTQEWTQAMMDKLNNDPQYADLARNWEGDICFIIDPGGSLTRQTNIYMDLWHGKCLSVNLEPDLATLKPAFSLRAPYQNFVRILKGELHPMQAMMTRKLQVQGNMAVMMRNVPVVLDFVRCAREVTDAFLES
jgi:putative sterol carrier protein